MSIIQNCLTNKNTRQGSPKSSRGHWNYGRETCMYSSHPNCVNLKRPIYMILMAVIKHCPTNKNTRQGLLKEFRRAMTNKRSWSVNAATIKISQMDINFQLQWPIHETKCLWIQSIDFDFHNCPHLFDIVLHRIARLQKNLNNLQLTKK